MQFALPASAGFATKPGTRQTQVPVAHCTREMQVANPRREDIECLCKLMSTIGGQLDASPKATTYMTAYFQRMEAIQQIASLEVCPNP